MVSVSGLKQKTQHFGMGFGEPVAWEWKRTHQTGGYTREVTVSHQQALDWAADSSNLPQADTVTPLYALKEEIGKEKVC